MSAIGSYEVVNRTRFAECLALARNVRTETTGKWIFKNTRTVGVEEFNDAWRAAVLKRADFDYSGYVIGDYLDAQLEVNDLSLHDEESEVGQTLSRVFTDAFVFDSARPLPELAEQKLQEFCRSEFEEEADEMVEAIRAAHAFYERGFGEITPENLVVFIIR